jgi:hypothetical protein
MPYEGEDNLNQLSTGAPLSNASPAELAEAIRELKLVFKNVMLQAFLPNGALRGITVDSLAPGSVGAAQVIDGAIGSAALALLAVLTGHLADGAVTSPKLADDAVTLGKIAPGAIGGAAFTNNSIPLTALGAALTSLYISNSSTDDNLRAIGSDHIKNLAVLDRCIAGMALAKLTGGTAGQILARGASGWEAVTPTGGLTYADGVFHVESPATVAHFGDHKSRGSAGGASANSWVTRDLGEIADADNIMTFVGNSFKLLPGKYFFYARLPAAGAVGLHQGRLYHTTPESVNTIKLWGTSEQCAASMSNCSVIQGTFEVTDGDELFRIEHWFQNVVATSGMGVAVSSLLDAAGTPNHVEVYTSGYVLKLTE